MDSLMLTEFDGIKKLTAREQIAALKEIKNQMIGCTETKLAYFNKGLIEVIVPLLADIYDAELGSEVLMILNCFTFDFPKALEIFGHFKMDLVAEL